MMAQRELKTKLPVGRPVRKHDVAVTGDLRIERLVADAEHAANVDTDRHRPHMA